MLVVSNRISLLDYQQNLALSAGFCIFKQFDFLIIGHLNRKTVVVLYDSWAFFDFINLKNLKQTSR
jgi:hypothetical protein